MTENTNPSSLEETLLPWIGRSIRSIDVVLTDKLKEANIPLTKAQIILLRKLTLNDGIPQNDLAFITDRDKTSLTRLIKLMEDKALVERRVSKDDKRVNLVYITQTGRDELLRAFPIIYETVLQAQKNIDQDHLEIAISVLKQLAINLNVGFTGPTAKHS